MIGTKLIRLIKTFSPDEIKSFEKFIDSPYFNSVKNYITFFKEIKKFYPEFNDSNLKREYIYKKLYKGKPFNKQVMWNLTSKLEKLTEEFLIQRKLEANEYYRYSLLLVDLSQRELYNYYKSKLNDFEKYSNSLLIGEEHETGIDYFKVKWKVSTSRGVYAQLLDRLALIGKIPVERSGYQLCGFIQHLAQDFYNMHFLEKTYNLSFDLNIPLLIFRELDLKKLIEELKYSKFKNTWILEFYYYKIMCLLEKNKEEHFTNFRKIFNEQYEQFSSQENYNTAATLTNYCLEKISEGKLKYREILFEINKFRLNENMFLSGGVFRKTLYIQILNTALSVSKIEWAEEFINKYSKYLKSDIRESIENLGKAFVYFKLKQYGDVHDSLNKVGFVDITDKLNVKNLIARTYYEKKEFEILLYHIDSTKHFLRNNKNISSSHKELHDNFYDFLHELVIAKDKNDVAKLRSLRKLLSRDITAIHREWLIENILEKDFR